MDDFSEQLAGSLAAGREDFTGALVEERQAHPRNVPPQYVMQPFSVKLSYNGKSWMTIDLEVGYNKISDTDEPDLVLPEDANAILEGLGFPPLGPIPVMALHHQIDQKLHAVSVPGSMRVHGLIDLQLLAVFRLGVGLDGKLPPALYDPLIDCLGIEAQFPAAFGNRPPRRDDVVRVSRLNSSVYLAAGLAMSAAFRRCLAF